MAMRSGKEGFWTAMKSGFQTPAAMQEPMYIKSALATPATTRDLLRRDGLAALESMGLPQPESASTAALGWDYMLPPPPWHGSYAPMPATRLEPVDVYIDAFFPKPEKDDARSDASTTDTHDAGSVELSNGILPPDAPDMPLPAFAAPQGLAASQHLSDVTGLEIPSIGSAKHKLGQCKPCAFVWKPEGCEDGLECKFCHLCTVGEKQRRKKARKAIARQNCLGR